MIGKQKCQILKEMRQRIADENNIPYKTRECTHKGDCTGTCPYCESEVRYLERELSRRKSLGKKITVAAVCTGMVLTASGCSVIDTVIDQLKTPTPEIYELEGEVPWQGETDPVPVDPEPLPTVTPEVQNIQFDLMGYVPPEGY